MKNRTRLLVVDGEAWVRDGLVMRLALEPDFEVAGEAGDSEAALRLALVLHPDVILMDPAMPGMDGFQAIRLLRAALPASRVLAVSLRDEMTARHAAAAAGAATFVAKQDGPDRLLAAIRELAGCGSRDGTAADQGSTGTRLATTTP
jgi:DNA-binding NarL/FixJ family response regulator